MKHIFMALEKVPIMLQHSGVDTGFWKGGGGRDPGKC